MAERTWEVSQVCFCDNVKQKVTLETEVLVPADLLPDPPRLLSHRCSLSLECNQLTRATCIWAGTNPDYDPFRG
jgi:hypothetical protein